jgi:hypothetical protein
MKIVAPKEANYCSDFMQDIPLGVVNKKLTGCGLSSVALENNKPTVICVPTREIIRNKVAQYPNQRRREYVFGLFGGVPLDSLQAYLYTTRVPKIMVTYDSFPKLLPYINDDYHIVVDEFSDLLDDYSYRSEAIDALLATVPLFSKVSYISATPMKPEYYPPQLQGLDYTEIEWQDIIHCKVKRERSHRPLTVAAKIISEYILGGSEGREMPNGGRSKSALFFVNSVTIIKQLINKTKLQPSQVRIICADKPENKAKLTAKYKIQTALDPEPLITFITKTAFKGCDFYSETGAVYVLSTTRNIASLLAVESDIYQIAGRIRTLSNPFRHMIHHIYSTDPSMLSAEEFNKVVDEKTKQTNDMIRTYEEMAVELRPAQLKLFHKLGVGLQDFTYLSLHGNIPTFNNYMVLNDRRRWEISHGTYINGAVMREAYLQASFDVNENQKFTTKEDAELQPEAKERLTSLTYKDKCLKFLRKREELDNYMATYEPEIHQAFHLLGAEKMKALDYRSHRIKEALKIVQSDVQQKLQDTVYQNFTKGGQYTLKEAKAKLQGIYDSLGMSSKAKATDLSRWFTTQQKNIKNTLYVITT